MTQQTECMSPHQPQQQQFQLHCNNSQMNGQISTQEQVQSVEEQSYKSRLQQFAQKAKLPLPSYRTTHEYQPLKFRGSVEVDGEIFTSSNTFFTRKAAEADAAKLALEGISEKIKNCASKKTNDGGFPPIHEDRVFCKSILHEFAAKMNLEKPTYDTVRVDSVECVVPLYLSSLVFDGVKYTGEPSVAKKEAEQLAARAVILSVLGNSGVETTLSGIVKSKAKQISAVNANSSVFQNSSVTPLLLSGSDSEVSVIKERASDNVQQCGDMTRNVSSGELQQQSASKKARNSESATDSCIVDGNGNVSITTHKVSSPGPLEHKFMKANLETLPQPSFLPQPSLVQNPLTFPQPSLLPSTPTFPQPNLPPNIQTQSQTSWLPSTPTLPQPSSLPNIQAQSQSSLLPSTQIVFQPNSQSSFPISPQTPLQSSLLLSTQTLPQSSLPPNIRTHSQPSLLPSTQILLQPRSQPSSPINPHPLLLSSLVTNSQTLPQSNCLPTTFIPSFVTQALSNETAASRRRKKKKANKKAKNAMEYVVEASNVPLSQAPSCTIAQNVLSSYQ